MLSVSSSSPLKIWPDYNFEIYSIKVILKLIIIETNFAMTYYVDNVKWSMDRAYKLVIDGGKGHCFPTPYF